MFCPNCGYDCKTANFCPNCGTQIKEAESSLSTEQDQEIPPLTEPYIQEINGKMVDLHKIIRLYGTGIRKFGAYSFLQSDYGLTMQQAKEILDPLYIAHAKEKVSFFDSVKAQEDLRKENQTGIYAKNAKKKMAKEAVEQRIQENKENGIACCPKCGSASITAQKKGFGFVKGAVGASIGVDVGLIAGGLGANKVILTCMNCGHQWKPGKK